MKRYSEDIESLKLRATYAAWEPTPELRFKAMDAVFEDCGTAAKIYADPATVTIFLVKAAAREFLTVRKRTEYSNVA